MLREVPMTDGVDGGLRRRWFTDRNFDLFVWTNAAQEIESFQLCYGKDRDERALTWKAPDSYLHQRVDDGESQPGRHKSTPVLLADGVFEFVKVADRFKSESALIDASISLFVLDAILAYGCQPVGE